MDVPLAHSYPRSPSPVPSVYLPPPGSPAPSFRKGERQDDSVAEYVPVPWRAFIPILCFFCADACTYAVVFPFITDMITSFDVPKDKIGLYAGFGEGVMMLVEACMATTWAKLADKKGRRWCLLRGFSITLVAMPLLGFSKAVWQVVVCRALLGLNSTGVLVKLCANEIGHPTNRTRIFSTLSPAYGFGFLISTFLGGELAHPFGRLPWWLGGSIELFKAHPYAYPCLTVLAIDAAAIVGGYFLLPETQRAVQSKEMSEKPQGKDALMETLRVPSFLLASAVSCLFQVSYFSWEGMFGVFTYTAPDHGGLGLPVDYIGILYSVGAALSILIQPLGLPMFRDAVGERKALTIALAAWTVLALVVPMCQWAAVHERWLMWVGLATIQCLRCLGNFGWAMTDILTMEAFDDYPELMATGSAISLIASAGGRAFGPSMSGWLYSISTTFEAGTLGRQIAWLYLVAMTLPAVFLAQLMSRSQKGNRPPKDEYEQVPLVENGHTTALHSPHMGENVEALHSR